MCFQVLLQVIRCGIASHSTLFVFIGLLSLTPEPATCVTISIQLTVLQPVTVILSSQLLLIFKEATSMKFLYEYFCIHFCLPHMCYEGESNENLKSGIKIRNTARLSCKLTTMILMV